MKTALTCPKCGATMNQHASKMVYSAEDGTETRETVLDIHTCPACGSSAATSE